MIQFLLCLVKTENDMDSLRIETNSSTQFKKMVYNTNVGHTFKHQNVFLLCILTSDVVPLSYMLCLYVFTVIFAC